VTADQLGLFGDDADHPATGPAATAGRLPASARSPGGSPVRVVGVLQDVRDGRLGVLDATGRVVEFYGDDQVRYSPDEDVTGGLIIQGYIAETGDRYRVTCRHGAIRRPVTPLRLTPDGKRLLLRWSSLAAVPD
jgi:hypothetical protein